MKIETIMNPLKKVNIDDSQFYRHNPLVVKKVTEEFTKFAVQIFVPERQMEKWSPHGIIQRIIDDYDIKCFKDASERINKIDLETGKEYNQMFFRLHPEKATKELYPDK